MRSHRIKFPNDWDHPKKYSRFEQFDWCFPDPQHRRKDHKYHLLIRQIGDYIVSTHKIDVNDCHQCPTCNKIQPFGSGLRDSWTCQLCGSDSEVGVPYDPDNLIDYSDEPDYKYFHDSFEYEYFHDRIKNAFKYCGLTKFGNHLFKRIINPTE